MIGFFAILLTIFWETTPPTDNPTKTSAPTIASSKDANPFSCANSSLYLFKSFLSFDKQPLESNMYIFLCFAPARTYNLLQEIAEAPAPLTTILTSARFLPVTSTALINAAQLMIAVPC